MKEADFYIRFGDLVTRHRVARGMNQITLASKVKVSQSLISKIEQGQVRGRMLVLLDIAKILRFNPNEARKEK